MLKCFKVLSLIQGDRVQISLEENECIVSPEIMATYRGEIISIPGTEGGDLPLLICFFLSLGSVACSALVLESSIECSR